MTIDDLLPSSGSDNFELKQDRRSGKAKIIKKNKPKRVKANVFQQYPTIFRLISDNPGIPDPVDEFRFHPVRKWRIDVCWPDQKLAVEIEGGVWTGGWHTHPSGFMKDKEKYNTLSVFGYHLLRFTPQEMDSCEAYDVIREWFKNNAEDT